MSTKWGVFFISFFVSVPAFGNDLFEQPIELKPYQFSNTYQSETYSSDPAEILREIDEKLARFDSSRKENLEYQRSEDQKSLFGSVLRGPQKSEKVSELRSSVIRTDAETKLREFQAVQSGALEVATDESGSVRAGVVIHVTDNPDPNRAEGALSTSATTKVSSGASIDLFREYINLAVQASGQFTRQYDPKTDTAEYTADMVETRIGATVDSQVPVGIGCIARVEDERLYVGGELTVDIAKAFGIDYCKGHFEVAVSDQTDNPRFKAKGSIVAGTESSHLGVHGTVDKEKNEPADGAVGINAILGF